jgi:hypothetical protein
MRCINAFLLIASKGKPVLGLILVLPVNLSVFLIHNGICLDANPIAIGQGAHLTSTWQHLQHVSSIGIKVTIISSPSLMNIGGGIPLR